MSGGSWDYLYRQIDEAADRLGSRGQSFERRALAPHLQRLAVAMRAVEWLDSCDATDDTTEIRAFLDGAGGADAQVSAVVVADLRALIATAGDLAARLDQVAPR